MKEQLLKLAAEAGFEYAAPLKVATLQPREDVRAMCAADKCGAYGKNWTCPPHCGSLAQCSEQLRRFTGGVLVQTVYPLKKTVDTKGYIEAERLHLMRFRDFCARVRALHPQALALGTGGCRICDKCAYPLPCRFPEEACPSMEAYGLLVSRVCSENGLLYHYGERTVSYTACVLYSEG